MPICFLGAILLILTQKSSQIFGDVLGIMIANINALSAPFPAPPVILNDVDGVSGINCCGKSVPCLASC